VSQKDKTKFRRSAKWKKFKAYVRKIKKVDCITLYPLRKGHNLHHLDLNEAHYEDVSDISHFEPLNRKTHETVHFLYPYYVKDNAIIDRLRDLLERMRIINESDKC
jgi:hypothetical protein